MPVIVGFDPGITGAACAVRIDPFGYNLEFIELFDLPSQPDGTKRQIHVEVLGNWLEKIEPDLAIIENVQPMMGKGAASQAMVGANSFRFGMACGAIRATVAAYSIPYRLVVPQVWKRAYGLRGSDKEASRKMAIRHLPAAEPFLKRKLDHNRADAVLLALYGAKSIYNLYVIL
jgi:crossover junction endodeoxyribonuclease RuvC